MKQMRIVLKGDLHFTGGILKRTERLVIHGCSGSVGVWRRQMPWLLTMSRHPIPEKGAYNEAAKTTHGVF